MIGAGKFDIVGELYSNDGKILDHFKRNNTWLETRDALSNKVFYVQSTLYLIYISFMTLYHGIIDYELNLLEKKCLYNFRYLFIIICYYYICYNSILFYFF